MKKINLAVILTLIISLISGNTVFAAVTTYTTGDHIGYSMNPKAYLEYGNDYDEETRVFTMVLSGENINVYHCLVALEYKDDYIQLCDADGELFPEENFTSVDSATDYTKYNGYITSSFGTNVNRFNNSGSSNEKNGSYADGYKMIGFKVFLASSVSVDDRALDEKKPIATICFRLKEGKKISDITSDIINLVSESRKDFYTNYYWNSPSLNMQSPLFVGDNKLETTTSNLRYHYIADRYTEITLRVLVSDTNKLIPDLTFTLVTPGSGEEGPEEPEEPDRENYSIVSNLKIYKPVYEDENKNSVSVWASLEDNNDGISDTIGFYYIAAVYDSENKLVDMKIFDKINLTEGGLANTAPLSLSELNIGSTDTVKVFSWNDLTGIKPVAMPAVLN